MTDTDLVTLRELARRTGSHVDAVRRWRDREGLNVYKLGSRHFVLWGEFMEWLKSHSVQSRTNSDRH